MLRTLGIFLLRLTGYGITILVGVLSVLWLIGWLVARNGPKVPGFEGFAPEDAEEQVCE